MHLFLILQSGYFGQDDRGEPLGRPDQPEQQDRDGDEPGVEADRNHVPGDQFQ